jgi:hypothetical protein
VSIARSQPIIAGKWLFFNEQGAGDSGKSAEGGDSGMELEIENLIIDH